MRIALNHHLVGQAHAAGLADAANVVAPQVDQHQMLGALFRIGQQFGLKRGIFGCVVTTATRAGNRAHGDFFIFQTHQNFRRRADHLHLAQIKEEHVRRGIQPTQGAVQIQRRRGKGNAHALRKHHLHYITGGDVFLGLVHRVLKAVLGKAGDEIAFMHLRRTMLGLRRSQGQAQLRFNGIQALLRGLQPAGLRMHDDLQTPAQVVEHYHLVGEHEQDVRRTDGVRLEQALRQTRLDVAHGVIAEVTNQPAGKTRQAVQSGNAETLLIAFDKGQRIGRFHHFHHLSIVFDAYRIALHLKHRARRQADNGVASPFLAAFHRLEQVAVRQVRELEVNGQRGIKIGEDFAHQRDAVVALGAELFKLFRTHDEISRKTGVGRGHDLNATPPSLALPRVSVKNHDAFTSSLSSTIESITASGW